LHPITPHDMTEPDLSYPIGRHQRKSELSAAERATAMNDLAATPQRLRNAVNGLDDTQLDTPYRPGGWTVRPLVHHVADSHMNAYTRFRLALTENNPTIKPYEEAEWAKLEDARTMPVKVSLDILDGIHTRLDTLLRSMSGEQFARTLNHPENGPMTL